MDVDKIINSLVKDKNDFTQFSLNQAWSNSLEIIFRPSAGGHGRSIQDILAQQNGFKLSVKGISKDVSEFDIEVGIYL